MTYKYTLGIFFFLVLKISFKVTSYQEEFLGAGENGIRFIPLFTPIMVSAQHSF